MSNRKEAVFAYLAITSIGGIWGGPLPFYGDKVSDFDNLISITSEKRIQTEAFKIYKNKENVLTHLPFWTM